LAAGSYVATLVAIDDAKKSSTPTMVSFAIVPR